MALHTPYRLVLDFDSTITLQDTTAVIGARCIEKAKELASPNLSADQLPKDMSHYSDAYFQQYKQWKENSKSPSKQCTTIDKELSWLSESRKLELDSFLRVRSALINTNGGIDDLVTDKAHRNIFMFEAGREAVRAGEVQIRDPKSLRAIVRMASRWGVVSVSWSRRFILGVLREAGLLIEGSEEDFAKHIKANEILAPLSASTQGGANVICSAMDKKEAFQKLLAGWQAEDVKNGTIVEEAMTIYVGDSSTDLGCLTDASIGLFIGKDQDAVVQTLHRLGLECEPLTKCQISPGNANPGKENTGRSPVYLINGFDEVSAWLSAMDGK